MTVHANAPLGRKGRETMVLRVLEQGWSRAQAAHAATIPETMHALGLALQNGAGGTAATALARRAEWQQQQPPQHV